MPISPEGGRGRTPIQPPQEPPVCPERLIINCRYEPNFPTVEIAAAQPGLIVTGAKMETLGLVAAPKPVKSFPPTRTAVPADGGRAINSALIAPPKAHGGEHADISRADFAWCITAIHWGWNVEDVAARRVEESAKAQENGLQYGLVAATNAAAAVQRRQGRDPRHEPAV